MKHLDIVLHILIAIVFAIFPGCDDVELIDTAGPEIEVKVPEWGSYLSAGEYVLFEATLTDDFELATYNVEIHDNFAGHEHGRIASIFNDPSLIKWSFKQSFLIPPGLNLFQAILEDDIQVPSNALAGPYHFIVQAIDHAGNSTSFQDDSAVELEIYIMNDSQPVINVTNLNNGELIIEKDIRFTVLGDITDPTDGEYAGMRSMDIILGEEVHEEHDHGGRIAEEGQGALFDVYFEEGELNQFAVDGAIILDKVFEHINFTISQAQLNDLIAEQIDHLSLTIQVNDNQGNIAVSNTVVHVNPN